MINNFNYSALKFYGTKYLLNNNKLTYLNRILTASISSEDN